MEDHSHIAGTVEALVGVLVIYPLSGSRFEDPEGRSRTARLLVGKIAAMPRHLSLPMLGLILALDVLSRIIWRRSFRSLPCDRQRRMIRWWSESRIGPLRDFVRFHKQMGTFLHLSRFEEERCLAVSPLLGRW